MIYDEYSYGSAFCISYTVIVNDLLKFEFHGMYKVLNQLLWRDRGVMERLCCVEVMYILAAGHWPQHDKLLSLRTVLDFTDTIPVEVPNQKLDFLVCRSLTNWRSLVCRSLTNWRFLVCRSLTNWRFWVRNYFA